jgi:hypothetical protein
MVGTNTPFKFLMPVDAGVVVAALLVDEDAFDVAGA